MKSTLRILSLSIILLVVLRLVIDILITLSANSFVQIFIKAWHNSEGRALALVVVSVVACTLLFFRHE